MLKKTTILVLLNIIAFSPALAQIEPEQTSEANSQYLSTTEAGGIKVGDIYRACKYYFQEQFNTKENVARKATCNGYFYGVGSTLITLSMSKVETAICLPKDISTEQIIKDFLDWVRANSNNTEFLAAEGTLTALTNKYPCF